MFSVEVFCLLVCFVFPEDCNGVEQHQKYRTNKKYKKLEEKEDQK